MVLLYVILFLIISITRSFTLINIGYKCHKCPNSLYSKSNSNTLTSVDEVIMSEGWSSKSMISIPDWLINNLISMNYAKPTSVQISVLEQILPSISTPTEGEEERRAKDG